MFTFDSRIAASAQEEKSKFPKLPLHLIWEFLAGYSHMNKDNAKTVLFVLSVIFEEISTL